MSVVILETYKKYEREIPFFYTQGLMSLVIMLNVYLILFILDSLGVSNLISYSIYLGERDISGGVLAVVILLISAFLLFPKKKLLKFEKEFSWRINKKLKFMVWAYAVLSLIGTVGYAAYIGSAK